MSKCRKDYRMRRNAIERAAQKLLEANEVTRAPIPVEELAHALNIDVRFSETSDDVSGALIRNADSAVIAVNSAKHENRQRFTIAHELGHFLLHRGTKLHFDEDFRIHYRDGISSEATKGEEIEANGFAAALLMPERILMRDWLRLEPAPKEIPDTIHTL